jgi:hypothetical protein
LWWGDGLVVFGRDALVGTARDALVVIGWWVIPGPWGVPVVIRRDALVVIGRSWWLILLVEGREGKGTGEQGVVVGRKMVIT